MSLPHSFLFLVYSFTLEFGGKMNEIEREAKKRNNPPSLTKSSPSLWTDTIIGFFSI